MLDLRYTEHPEEYSGPLEKAYATASKNLLELLIADNDLIGHLKSVKHYFLLSIVLQLITAAEGKIGGGVVR